MERSLPDTAGHDIQQHAPPIRELIHCVERLTEIAESSEPPALKLGRLCTQLAAAMHWAEQVRSGDTDGPPPAARGPHWQSDRGRQPDENRPVGDS